MNRPPRKKKAAEPTPDRQEQAAAAPESAATSQDDRNIVSIDQAFQEADVEDKVWLFWERNKGTLIGGSLLAIIAVLGVEGYRYSQRQAEINLQKDYQQAVTETELASFGNAHAAKPLGAFALLEAADDKYEVGDFSEAASLYGQSAVNLIGTPFYGRALLGEAMALIKSGQADTGASKLSQLADDSGALDATRAEAAFNLSLLALAQGNYPEANQWVEKVHTLSADSLWDQRAQSLADNTPELEALRASQPSGESSINVEAAPKEDLPPSEVTSPVDSTAAAMPDTEAQPDAEQAITSIPETGDAEDAE